ncbi:hypothetical protein FFX78_03230 [Staphylococcus aureus]|nr:hypothetical protein [Staphylococcus aureus]OHS00441.1 hypothetical protein HMPREF3247_04725 [Staphylococcus sp. HMSC36A10]MBG1149299.1 hypothetical protein [Staphylococcus aureus]MCU4272062.1 hypothetical protein [Staphylococcus aureus]PSM77722.1 hypothetical protein B9Y43_12020 [Staphylococcus aureus]
MINIILVNIKIFFFDIYHQLLKCGGILYSLHIYDTTKHTLTKKIYNFNLGQGKAAKSVYIKSTKYCGYKVVNR